MSVINGEYYTVQVGHSEEFNREVYQIVNNTYSVVEYEHPMLAQVREVFHVLEKNEKDIANGEKIVNIREAVQVDTPEGSTSH